MLEKALSGLVMANFYVHVYYSFNNWPQYWCLFCYIILSDCVSAVDWLHFNKCNI